MPTFDKNKFADLLEKAKGNRSINNYAQKSGVTAAHISRLIRGLLDTAPAPQTIRKLADHAHNEIKYEDFMRAAGHIEDGESEKKITYPEEEEEETFNPLNKINELLDKYGIEDIGFRDIEKWKVMGPEDIKRLDSYFNHLVIEAEKRKREED
jgi:transcriptional regulator with XRE-family HTH domain